ncbi:hypothetical protein BC936DRAFT_143714 [Jimgerdemannia flammicorona]|uniref:Transcription elongation factor 1 homolog n=1 Tax=Jimgerdemannia flammicorona TaxID=994334 RepID=A0A432ZYK1_9FUNG|nr:hypothetical protein BC936DRAFT_143714 [Jimgerdemannia flammicorona]
MGKRKSKRKPQVKKKDVLDTQFNCLFCNYENSIECLRYLSEATDVYHKWIDACDAVNKVKPSTHGGGSAGGSHQRPVDGEEEDDYEECDRGGRRRQYADGSEEEED